MPSPALSTFMPILIVVLAMIVWWRTTVVLVAAFLVAVLVIGVHELVSVVDGSPAQRSVIAPPVSEGLPAPESVGRTGPR